mmetsp:Transcript_32057/g.61691  ORF Transcript_32057/g.61691 Transcript_32057/m.61691 type:complete len:81 (-) Transcript_32057:35-277(-)
MLTSDIKLTMVATEIQNPALEPKENPISALALQQSAGNSNAANTAVQMVRHNCNAILRTFSIAFPQGKATGVVCLEATYP